MCEGITIHRLVTDLGFPREGGANSPGGAPTYDFAKISQKLHEIERIWTPPLDPPLQIVDSIIYESNCWIQLIIWIRLNSKPNIN